MSWKTSFSALGLLALVAGPVLAAPPQPKLLVSSSGNCKDADLFLATSAVQRHVRARMGSILVGDELATAKLGQPITSDPAELQRRIDAAQMQYYNSEFNEADKSLLDAMAQIDQLPPGAVRNKLKIQALQVGSLLYRSTSRFEQSDDMLRLLLKLSPGHQLDPVYFSPPARQRFEKLRAEQRKAPKVPFKVTSSPSGAEVYVDGIRVGSTPHLGEYVAGPVEVRLTRDGRWSLPRQINLRQRDGLHVDLAFEGSVGVEGKNCIFGGSKEEERLSSATKLGGLFGVADVIIVRMEPAAGSGFWLSAELVGVNDGKKQRQGSVKIESRTELNAVTELAAFILTGTPSTKVAEGPPPVVSVAPTPTGRGPELTREAPPGGRGWRSVAGTGGLALGVAGLAAGVAFELDGGRLRKQVEAYYAGGSAPTREQLPQVAELARRADAQRTNALISAGAGVVLTGVGTYLLFTDGSAAEPPVSVSLTPTSVAIRGAF